MHNLCLGLIDIPNWIPYITINKIIISHLYVSADYVFTNVNSVYRSILALYPTWSYFLQTSWLSCCSGSHEREESVRLVLKKRWRKCQVVVRHRSATLSRMWEGSGQSVGNRAVRSSLDPRVPSLSLTIALKATCPTGVIEGGQGNRKRNYPGSAATSVGYCYGWLLLGRLPW